jgi:predicted phosphoribosyltransferase
MMLQSEYGHSDDGMILAIPSGGVPVGLKMSKILGFLFDLLIVRKLQIPGNPEAGFGAMTLAGTVVLDDIILAQLRLNPSQIEVEKNGSDWNSKNATGCFGQNVLFPI